MVTIPLGTKENLYVDVEDKLKAITTLDALLPRYRIVKRHTDEVYYDFTAAINNGMRIACMVDTTVNSPTGRVWTRAVYQLFIDFAAAPEKPLLGPMDFKVE